MIVHITLTGELKFIWNDDLAPLLDLGKPTVQRASNVEPNEDGQWVADLSPVNGPALGPYRLRGDALAAEVEWLQQHGF
jgi:hypothetical protein